MIVFAAVVPHSPLLVPSIGKEHTEKLANTTHAYAELEQTLYLAKPDTLVMISPHAQMYPDAMSGNASPKFTAVLKQFGDRGRPGGQLSDRIGRSVHVAGATGPHRP